MIGKNIDIFDIFAENIDCEYQQSYLRKKKKNKKNVYPDKPQFYYIKVVGLKEVYMSHSPFLHYRLVSSLEKINIENAGNQNRPDLNLTLRSGWFWLPVFSILIFESWKPADNAKMMMNRCYPDTSQKKKKKKKKKVSSKAMKI